MNPELMRAKWELYAKAWSPANDAERKQILEDTLSPDFFYIDPRIECRGQKKVTSNLEAFQQRQPGGSFVLQSMLPHHYVALLNWQ